jgi:site-specific recombinase XerD
VFEEIDMGILRDQMERAMGLHRLSLRTQQSYADSVAALAKHYRRRPDLLTEAEVQSYLLYLIEERKLAHSSCKVALHGLRFFYCETLKRGGLKFDIPRARTPQKLPQILSREEIERLLAATRRFKDRVLLMTTYAAGLRVSEVCALKVTDIDSDRMTIRVEQGKGAKDRYSLLSARLLKDLRKYWEIDRPAVWLFPAPRMPHRPMNSRTAQRIFYRARDRAKITKRGGIHALRHAFATHLLEDGTDVHTIQRLMGHGDIQTTMRYFHLAQQRITATTSPLESLRPT